MKIIMSILGFVMFSGIYIFNIVCVCSQIYWNALLYKWSPNKLFMPNDCSLSVTF